MLNGSRVSREAGSLAEGSSSTSSASNSSSAGDKGKVKGMGSGSTSERHRLDGGAKSDNTAWEPSYYCSQSPRASPAVPLLTEKQQQLLLRYLCVSNDEASRVLMQAAARQHIYSTTGQEKASVATGDRTTAATIRDRGGGAAAAAAFPHEGGPSGATGAEKRISSLGWRAAARASCSSPVSPFAGATRHTSNNVSRVAAAAAATAVKFSGATTTRLLEQGASSWTDNNEPERPLQPQSKRRSQQYEHVLISRPHPQFLYVDQVQQRELEEKKRKEHQQRQQMVTPQQHQQVQQVQQQTQQHQADLRGATDGSILRAAEAGGADDAVSSTQAVCPLRPCLRRRSNVRFRSPVAEDPEEQQQANDSAATARRRASTQVHSSPSERTRNNPSVAAAAAADSVVSSSTCTFAGKTACCLPFCPHASCCFPSCHMRDVSSCHSALPPPPLLRSPSHHPVDVDSGTGASECPTNLHAQNVVHCCCRCSASAACCTIVSQVPGLQGSSSCCFSCSRLLCHHDRQAAAQAPAGGVADPREAPVISTEAAQASLPPSTSPSVPRRHQWDAEASVEDRSYCCRVVACPSSVRRENNLCCCCCSCCTCCNRPLYLDQASSISSHDEQEEKPCLSTSFLRQRVPRFATAPEDQTTPYDPGEPAVARAAGATARGLTTRREEQENQEGRGEAEASAQVETSSTVRQLFSRYLPSHEEEGPRPCCGPGRNEMIMQQQQQQCAHEEEIDEEICCCSCIRLVPASECQQTPIFVASSNTRSSHDKVRSCYMSGTRRQPATIFESFSVLSAGASPPTAADVSQATAAADAQQEDGRGLTEKGGSASQQRSNSCRHCYHHTQQQHRDILPTCCSRHAGHHIRKTGKEQQCCSTHSSHLPFPANAAATTAADEEISRCSAAAGSLVYERQGLSPSLAQLDTTNRTQEVLLQQQQQLCVHSKGCAAVDSLQRRYIYLKPAGAVMKTPPTASGLPAAAGGHTPSTTAMTLSNATTPSATLPAYTSTPVTRSEEVGNVPMNVRETEMSSRLRMNTPPRLPSGRTLIARTLTGTIPVRRVAAPAAAPETAATGISIEGPEKTKPLEERLWKFGAAASSKQPLVGKAFGLSESKSPASLKNSRDAERASAASAAAQPSANSIMSSSSGAVSGVNTVDWGSSFSVERLFPQGKEVAGSLITRNIGTPAARFSAVVATSGTGPAAGQSAAGLDTISAVAGVGNSTGAPPAANGTVSWSETREDGEQLAEDLQQLLQRQQEELAEQLRRLDVLEKRQQELRQPQLRRRQDWWLRLQALEQQLHRQKAALEQQQHQRSVGMQQMTEQGSVKQQLLQSSREQQQTNGRGVYWSLTREQQQQQQHQINGQQQPAGKAAMPQSHLQQRRGSHVLPGNGGQTRDLGDASGDARSSLSGKCSQFHVSRIFSQITEDEPDSQKNNAAPASLVVLSRSTRKFQPPHSVQQQQQRQHRLQQQRLQHQEGRHQQQEVKHQCQRPHHRNAYEKWPLQPKEKSVAPPCGVAVRSEDSSANACRNDHPCFTVESEQLLLDEDDEEQELLELQEISEALEAAEF